MKSFLKDSLLGTLLFFLSSMAIAAGYVFYNKGFGLGDLQSWAFWSAALSPIVAFILCIHLWASRKSPTWFALIKAVLVSVLLAYILLAAAHFILGPWMGAFSFPVGVVWFASCLTAFVWAQFRIRALQWRYFVLMILLPFAGVLFAVKTMQAKVPQDLIVYLNKDATDADRNHIWTDLLSTPNPEGKGYNLLNSIVSLGAADTKDQTGIRVQFQRGTDEAHIEEIIKKLTDSKLVERFERVAPMNP